MGRDDGEDRMELATGLRLAAIAFVSAIVTATAVIGAGGAWLDRTALSRVSPAPGPAPSQAVLVRTAG